jgi:hypothetical protein
MNPHLNGKVTPKSLPSIKSNVQPQFFEITPPKFSYPQKMETPPKRWDHAPN